MGWAPEVEAAGMAEDGDAFGEWVRSGYSGVFWGRIG